MSLDRFVQATRKIILKLRLEKILVMLRKFIESWNEALNEGVDNDTTKLSIESFIGLLGFFILFSQLKM